MVKDNKINIKLEVCRDKTSGKLIIMAHFDSKAPNVFIDKDNYSWMPTFEEHDLINEAFDFFPIFDSGGHAVKKTPKETEIKDESKPEQEEELKIEEPIIKKDQEIKTEEPQTEEPQTEELPPLEANDEPAVFEKVEEETKPDEFEKIINDAINEKESEKAPIPEEPAKDKPIEDNDDKEDDTKNKDEGVLVEADGDAIERALKKHKDSDKDESMVEADEQMIIDKVLSQKKKGKWSKK